MNYFILLCLIVLLAGCSSSTQQQGSSNAGNNAKQTQTTVNNSAMGQDELLFYLLRKEFSYWQGTPYRLGGDSKKGIDCSAFVQHVYRDSINIRLPRTTETQVNKGYLVYRDQLQIGDLVFFKTGWKTRHVGIYMGNDQFIHASTSKGVISSSLNNVYWKKKYWQARRLID